MKPLGICFLIMASMAVGLTRGHSALADDGLDDFMRAKLVHSQNVVEGLVRADFDKIAKGAQELSLLSLAENWQVLQTPQYIEFSKKFRKSADSLSESARKKNLDQATKDYNIVLQRCVECHKYLRDVRMARAD
jgi:hypothetical protein